MRHILIATDLSAAGSTALHRACQLASHHCAALTILHVVSRAHPPTVRAVRAEELAAVAEAQAIAHPCISSVYSEVGIGRPSSVIAATAARLDADLIVVGARGQVRWADELFGSTVEKLVRHTAFPVLVVHNQVRQSYRRIIAAIDEGPLARETLELAATMASAQSLFAVHAFLPTVAALMHANGVEGVIEADEQRRLEETVGSVLGGRSDLACHIQAITRRGDPVSVITRAMATFQGELLVLVTSGRSGLALALRGSFADLMIEGAPFDLLIRHHR